MAKDNSTSKEDEQKIRQALHYTVGEICKDESKDLDVVFSKATRNDSLSLVTD